MDISGGTPARKTAASFAGSTRTPLRFPVATASPGIHDRDNAYGDDFGPKLAGIGTQMSERPTGRRWWTRSRMG